MSITRTVEVHLAFRWDCDDCGRENFGRMRLPTPAEIEAEGEDGHEVGTWLVMPDFVTCPHCGAEFETVEPGMEGETP